MFHLFRRDQPSPRQLQKALKRLTETHGEQSPRIEAAERLADWGTPESIYTLIKRFTVSSRVITQDIEEKQNVVDMLIQLETEAIDPLLRFIKNNHQVDWPVRALAEIVSEEALATYLVDTIQTVALSEFAPAEQRVSLLRAVRAHVTTEMAPLLRGFLNDSDDDVRIAAIHNLSEIGSSERETLLETFLNSPERPRIQLTIVDLFADLGWGVKGYRPKIEQNLPEGFLLNGKGVIQRR